MEMPTIEKRVSHLEGAVEAHLIESGEIRADLKWVKKMIWFVFTSPFLIEAVKHIHMGVAK
jgi:hypothetical protein